MKLHNKVALRGVNFSFEPGGRLFFENISMECKVGVINFVCGKNGMGKSTLLKIISGNASGNNTQGILQVGRVEHNLAEPGDMGCAIAMVAQNFTSMLVDQYSFYENMQFALLSQYPSCKALPKPELLPALLDKYAINQNIPIYLLSGGQRQILSILMVLQRSPKILLLDEPTAALDEENAEIVMNFLQDVCVQKNITMIAIVHNLDIVERYGGASYFELYQESGVRSLRMVTIAS